MPIFFHSEEVEKPNLDFPRISDWINSVIETHDRQAGEINYIFCSSSYLHEMNRKHLNHDFETDIITFNLGENQGTIDADIYISVENVKENAKDHETEFNKELKRVMIHGILHLLGFNDHTDEEKETMRNKENECLKMLPG